MFNWNWGSHRDKGKGNKHMVGSVKNMIMPLVYVRHTSLSPTKNIDMYIQLQLKFCSLLVPSIEKPALVDMFLFSRIL